MYKKKNMIIGCSFIVVSVEIPFFFSWNMKIYCQHFVFDHKNTCMACVIVYAHVHMCVDLKVLLFRGIMYKYYKIGNWEKCSLNRYVHSLKMTIMEVLYEGLEGYF